MLQFLEGRQQLERKRIVGPVLVDDRLDLGLHVRAHLLDDRLFLGGQVVRELVEVAVRRGERLLPNVCFRWCRRRRYRCCCLRCCSRSRCCHLHCSSIAPDMVDDAFGAADCSDAHRPPILDGAQFDDLARRDPLHARRAGYRYGFAALNFGVRAMADGGARRRAP